MECEISAVNPSELNTGSGSKFPGYYGKRYLKKAREYNGWNLTKIKR